MTVSLYTHVLSKKHVPTLEKKVCGFAFNNNSIEARVVLLHLQTDSRGVSLKVKSCFVKPHWTSKTVTNQTQMVSITFFKTRPAVEEE